MAVFLVIAGLAFGSLFINKTGVIEGKGVFGGPSSLVIPKASGAGFGGGMALLTAQDAPVLSAFNANDGSPATLAMASPAIFYSNIGALGDPGQPIGPAFDRSGTLSYKVQQGDNLSKIASYFGISVQTILSANPGVRAKFLKPGDQLKILPTSGVVYQVKSGDTLDSIAQNFDISKDKISQFNHSVDFASLDPGMSVIIPGGTSANRLVSANSGLPNFNSEFIMPTNGYNWGILHHYNAVDIANSCGTPVVAAADGVVIPDPSLPDIDGGWNGGYGNFVLLEHPFGDGVRTRYAHLEKISVQIGDYVKQGQTIGLMGESGDATGCHLHFEVIGARNPFAKS